jgi:hypothetical protein
MCTVNFSVFVCMNMEWGWVRERVKGCEWERERHSEQTREIFSMEKYNNFNIANIYKWQEQSVARRMNKSVRRYRRRWRRYGVEDNRFSREWVRERDGGEWLNFGWIFPVLIHFSSTLMCACSSSSSKIVCNTEKLSKLISNEENERGRKEENCCLSRVFVIFLFGNFVRQFLLV